MVKRIAQQVTNQIPRRLTRTERRLEERRRDIELQKKRELLKAEQEKISKMSIEEYKEYYPSMEGWMQSSFVSPTQVEAQQQQIQQQQIAEGVGKIDDKISYQESQLEKYEQAKRDIEEREYSDSQTKAKALSSVDYKITIAKKYIEEYRKAKSNVQKGYSYDSSVRVAEQSVESYADRTYTPEAELRPLIVTMEEIDPTTQAPVVRETRIYKQFEGVDRVELQKAYKQYTSPEGFQIIETWGKGTPKDRPLIMRTKDLPRDVIFREMEKKLVVGENREATIFEKTLLPIVAPIVVGTDVAYKKTVEGYKAIPETEYLKEYIGVSFQPRDFVKVFLEKDVSYLKPDITYAELIGEREEDLTKIQELRTKRLEEAGIIKKVEPEFITKYQSGFEERYMQDIIAGNITFERAKEIYSETEYSQKIQEDYSKALEKAEREAKLPIDKESFKIAGYTLKSLAPRSDKEIVLTAGMVASGVFLFKILPAKLVYAYTAYRGVSATIKALSPTALPEERILSGGEAVLSGAILTAGAVKYLKSPVVRTEKIYPKQTLTRLEKTAKIPPSKQTVIIKRGDKVVRRDMFKWVSREEQIIAGRRTIVSTKFREFLRGLQKGLGVQEKARVKTVYEGIPYRDIKGYGKALTKLTKYGIPETKAKAMLRYYQPRVYQYRTEGITAIYTGTDIKLPRLTTYAERTMTPQVRIIDKRLGIKTRGGTRQMRFIYGKGEQVAFKDGNVLYRNVLMTEKAYISPKGNIYTKVREAGKLRTMYDQVSVVKFQKGAKRIDLYKERSVIQKVLPREFKRFEREGELLVFKQIKEPPKVIIDIDELTGVKARQIPTKKKVPFKPIEQYGTEDFKTLVKNLRRVYGDPKKPLPISQIQKPQPSTQQVRRLLTKPAPPIEKVDVKMKQVTSILEEQKSFVLPKNIIGIRGVLGVKEALRVKTRTVQRTKLNLKLREKLQTSLKQTPKLKEALEQRTWLRTTQTVTPVTPTQFPAIEPILPQYTSVTATPTIVLPPQIKDILRKRIIVKPRKKKRGVEYTYAPTFTEKALGIDPIKITETQAEKLLKKELTGFELVPAVVIK